LDQGPEKLRVNPRKTYYRNLDRVSTNGDFEVTFRLKRPQPAFPMLLADGFMAIYPCHAPPREMRQHPIGTGPFKFVEFKPNEYVKVARNPAYWKKDRPYLDGIEYIIIRDRATAVLAFVSGKFDMTFPNYLTIPLVKDIQSQMPQVICELSPEAGVNRHLLINRDKPPFDNRNVRQAMALSLDRKAFIDTLTEGQGDIGGVLQPPLGGLWGMPPDLLEHLPGFPDVQKRRTQARQIMEQMGYGPDNRLKTKISIRNMPLFRDPAVILIDQLKEIYIGGELEPIDTTAYYPTILRKDYAVGLNLATSGPDPDPILDLFYGCGSSLNWDGYCSPEVDSLIEQQSREGDPEKRKPLLWAIEQKLAQDVARPIVFYGRNGTCWQPSVKEVTIMVNSLFNGNRPEDVWLDK
jgi:peptide/nickel transport system substrate-binding protein